LTSPDWAKAAPAIVVAAMAAAIRAPALNELNIAVSSPGTLNFCRMRSLRCAGLAVM